MSDKQAKYQQIEIEDIEVPKGRRPIGDLTLLKESMKEHGQLEPIIVTEAEDGYRLVAGAHRFTAAKELGNKKIYAHIMKLDHLTSKLIEIEENLVRNELKELEQCRCHKQRKTIMEKLGLVRKHGGSRKGEKSSGKNLPLDQKSYASGAAKVTNRSERSIRDSLKIATDIPEDLQIALLDTEAGS